jgi:hypothetical protein
MYFYWHQTHRIQCYNTSQNVPTAKWEFYKFSGVKTLDPRYGSGVKGEAGVWEDKLVGDGRYLTSPKAPISVKYWRLILLVSLRVLTATPANDIFSN